MNMQGHLADAKADFKKILDLSSSDVRRQAKTFLQLGRICLKRKELAEARQHLQKAVEIDQEVDILTVEEKAEIGGVLN
jgi:Tfp pilus assembly protein PilF